ncbi:hypothetical protein Fcan01_28024 [Folsomia candida]|uniref:Uncharacterized protein n=1 Tax=Folsomia candida TaxID=158441 RepID=A0A226CYV3_FOLCA|nr:hypothetical protein Fcan01_28024 [Folsomia candida]
MDRIKKQRAPVRAGITKTIKELEVELAKTEQDKDALEIKMRKLRRLMVEVKGLDQNMKDALLDGEAEEEEYATELESIEEYKDRIEEISHKVGKVFSPSSPSSSCGTANSEHGRSRNFKLPKIQLQKFCGDMKDWLGWWSQFTKIDEDDQLHPSDKFQYLLQSMVQGSRARGLVESFPMTAENYLKAIAALKERFGKEKFLQQVYVRELLRLVITTAKSNESVVLSKLYDDIETQLRALESLGIKAEQSTQFLFPMESCLPEKILLTWQRSPLRKQDGSQLNPKKNELDYLMEFLREEMEGEQTRKSVRAGFEITTKVKENKNNQRQVKAHQKQSEDVPTVAGLMNVSSVKSLTMQVQNVSRLRR